MKNLSRILLLIIVTVVLVSACGGAVYEAGTYEGEGEGRHGSIKVSVTVDAKKITAVKIIESEESDFALPSMKTVIKDVIEKNSGEVDVVSGATETTGGLIDAISDALSEAEK